MDGHSMEKVRLNTTFQFLTARPASGSWSFENAKARACQPSAGIWESCAT